MATKTDIIITTTTITPYRNHSISQASSIHLNLISLCSHQQGNLFLIPRTKAEVEAAVEAQFIIL